MLCRYRLRSSLSEGVHGVQNILCVAGNSWVPLQSSLVANNTARAVLIAGTGDAHVTMNASIVGNIPGNTVWPGAGLVVMANASVVVLNSSITGNIASRAGGGLAISFGAPQVTLIASCICESVVRGVYLVCSWSGSSIIVTYIHRCFCAAKPLEPHVFLVGSCVSPVSNRIATQPHPNSHITLMNSLLPTEEADCCAALPEEQRALRGENETVCFTGWRRLDMRVRTFSISQLSNISKETPNSI